MLISDLTSILNQANLQTPSRTPSPTIDKQGFLELLVKQLSTQDPLDPMSNDQFVQQLAMFGSLEQEINLNQSFTQFMNYEQLTQASTLLGKDVICVVQGDNGVETKEGVVDQVEMIQNVAYLKLSTGDEIPLASVVSVQPGGTS
jgi:flagellar basal-body rod modification protein FlgD